MLGWCFILLFALPWSYFGIQVPFSGNEYKLGLDLQGGIELDYKIDLSEAQQEEWYDAARKKAIIEGLKSIIDKRVESLNINDSVITGANYGGEEHIIVQIPLKGNDELQNWENIERAKAAIGKVVKIEFKEVRDTITETDIAERKNIAYRAYEDLSTNIESFNIEIQKYQNKYENIVSWTTMQIEEIFSGSGIVLNFSESITDTGISQEILEVKNLENEWGYLIYKLEDRTYSYIFIGAEPSIWIAAQDSKGRILDDKYFVNASVQYNDAFQAMVELTFNTEGAKIFGELTDRLVGNPIAIFVGWELLTAPNVNEAILSWRAVITGNYTPESASALAQDINTWVVPAPIYLTSERTIDAKLGQNSLEKIILAGIIGFISILLFLIFIYRLSGFIAAVALFIYIVITLAILKQFGVVLTLASIAGLVLSIGIAIDANILIFERIKDELKTWENLKKSVKIGFEKSFSAIWDANITGLIVAWILFIFGINMIKGFWFILALWILVSLFTVFFISRLFIRLLARSELNTKNFIWK